MVDGFRPSTLAASVTQPELLCRGRENFVPLFPSVVTGSWCWQSCPAVWQLPGAQPSSRWELCSKNPGVCSHLP